MAKNAITLDHLAEMIKTGFDGVDERFDVLEKDVSVLKQDVSVLKQDVGVLKKDVFDLKIGQEDMLHKLNNAAYRFELRDLDQRVTYLEKHAGLTAKPKPAH